jgi:hypothetical protein
MGMLIATLSRGLTVNYRPLSARRGEITVNLPGSRNLPDAAFYSFLGTIDLVFKLAGVADGVASDPMIVDDGMRNKAVFSISW